MEVWKYAVAHGCLALVRPDASMSRRPARNTSASRSLPPQVAPGPQLSARTSPRAALPLCKKLSHRGLASCSGVLPCAFGARYVSVTPPCRFCAIFALPRWPTSFTASYSEYKTKYSAGALRFTSRRNRPDRSPELELSCQMSRTHPQDCTRNVTQRTHHVATPHRITTYATSALSGPPPPGRDCINIHR